MKFHPHLKEEKTEAQSLSCANRSLEFWLLGLCWVSPFFTVLYCVGSSFDNFIGEMLILKIFKIFKPHLKEVWLAKFELCAIKELSVDFTFPGLVYY